MKRGIVDDLNDLLGLVLPALDAQSIRPVRLIPINQVSKSSLRGISQTGQVNTASSVANSNQSVASNADDSDGIAVLPIKAGDVSGIAIIPMRQQRTAAVNKTPVGSGQMSQGESEVRSNSAVNPGRFSS